MSGQSQFQSSQDMSTLLAECREIAANTEKCLGTGQTAEATRDLLLDFDHANIALCLRIVEWHRKTLQEAQYGLLMLAESVEQIACGTLFAPSSFERLLAGRRIRRIGLIAFLQERLVLGFPIGSFGGIKMVQASLSCLFDRSVHIRKQGVHRTSPALLLFFVQKGQFSLVMHIAERMLARILPIGAPSIVNTDACKPWENANGFQSITAAFGMHCIMRQMSRGRHMAPQALAHHIRAGFILMQDIGLAQVLLDLLFYRLQLLGTPLHLRFEGANRHGWSQKILDGFTGTFIRQELLLRQVHSNSSYRRTILNGSRDACGKRCPADGLAVRTHLLFGAMLDHHPSFGRHVHHLPTFNTMGDHLPQIVLTAGADLDRIGDHLVWLADLHQGRALMSRLRTWLLLAWLAQTPGLLLPRKAIRRRGQMTIVAIFGQPIFYLLQSAPQAGYLLMQGLIFCPQGRIFCSQCGIFFSKVTPFFFLSHVATLLLL